jgi:hypothetical protein
VILCHDVMLIVALFALDLTVQARFVCLARVLVEFYTLIECQSTIFPEHLCSLKMDHSAS